MFFRSIAIIIEKNRYLCTCSLEKSRAEQKILIFFMPRRRSFLTFLPLFLHVSRKVTIFAPKTHYKRQDYGKIHQSVHRG